MKHIKKFNESIDFSNNSKRVFIEEFINKQVKKSADFNLIIEEEDIKKEKELLTNLIIDIWDDIINSNDSKYKELMNYVYNELEGNLNGKYYFDKYQNNSYSAHIYTLVSTLFMYINNKLFK
jgi:hypothetical protein